MDEKTYIIKIKTFSDTTDEDLLNAIDNLFFTLSSGVVDVFE